MTIPCADVMRAVRGADARTTFERMRPGQIVRIRSGMTYVPAPPGLELVDALAALRHLLPPVPPNPTPSSAS
jgi:hypothetical protein